VLGVSLAEHARAIWDAGVAAVEPGKLVLNALAGLTPFERRVFQAAPHIHVVGCGKAGAAMAEACESGLAEFLDRVTGLVNVPDGSSARLTRIRLHWARPQGSNHPTEAGVAGAAEILAQMQAAGPDDVAICLISGGGSALLPLPAVGISLSDKQSTTKLLHSCGATIREMNAVRKHLSRIKGGRLAEAFRGKFLLALIVSDVVGDPLDVIASGPTAPDPTTFADAVNVVTRYGLADRIPAAVMSVLRRGVEGIAFETPKQLPASTRNLVIGSNATALAAAAERAAALGYRVLDLGPFVEGETGPVAITMAGIVRSIRERNRPVDPPVCLLSGGETTVTLGSNSGKGGRNQEFVLAMMQHLGESGMENVCVLSAGTDGEDGPTDAAGALATRDTIRAAKQLNLSLETHLARHDAYPLFDQIGGLLKCGLTGTNVMDLRIILVDKNTL
jgi:glycerate 2-kinase